MTHKRGQLMDEYITGMSSMDRDITSIMTISLHKTFAIIEGLYGKKRHNEIIRHVNGAGDRSDVLMMSVLRKLHNHFP